MKIEINDYRKIFAVQEEFHYSFPDFKLEFYQKLSIHGGPVIRKLLKSSTKTLAECRATHNSGFVSVPPGTTVGELKHSFGDEFGLEIDIYKNSVKNTLDGSEMKESIILEEQTAEV